MSRSRLSKYIIVRPRTLDDARAVLELSQRVYGHLAWTYDQLCMHTKVFPDGQLVAIDTRDNAVVANASSVVVNWDDYNLGDTDDDMTADGWFTNHDPAHGHTLYGADVCVDPERRRMGIGKKIYAARRELCRSLKLRRIRAGARIRGYHRYAHQMSPEEYVIRVVNREIDDPTLTFQLRQGFRVIAVVRHHQSGDPESHGHAAIIEWINHQVAARRDYARRDPRFARRRRRRPSQDHVTSMTDLLPEDHPALKPPPPVAEP